MIPIKVLIVDDDPFVRSTLGAALSNLGIQGVESAESASIAMQVFQGSKTDVAIIDLDLGVGPNGIDLCRALRLKNPRIGLILLTSYRDPRVFDPSAPALPKGCRFISKSDLHDFKTLIENVFAAHAKPFASKTTITSKVALTTTQLEVLKLIADGLSSSEIAKMRKVSEKAIENIISKIQKIAGIDKSKSVNKRVKLARYYFYLSGKKISDD